MAVEPTPRKGSSTVSPANEKRRINRSARLCLMDRAGGGRRSWARERTCGGRHAPARAGRRPLGGDRRPDAAQPGAWRALAGPPADRQRDVLEAQHGRALARHPRALRAVADDLWPVRPVAGGRHAGAHHRAAAAAARRGGPDRLGSMVHRRHRDPGRPGGGRGAPRGLLARASRPTTRSGARAAASAASGTW
jgi:hypothetical protein